MKHEIFLPQLPETKTVSADTREDHMLTMNAEMPAAPFALTLFEEPQRTSAAQAARDERIRAVATARRRWQTVPLPR